MRGANQAQASWPHVLRAVPKKIGAVCSRTSVAVGPFLRAPTPAHRASTQFHGSRWGAMAGAEPGGWGGEGHKHTTPANSRPAQINSTHRRRVRPRLPHARRGRRTARPDGRGRHGWGAGDRQALQKRKKREIESEFARWVYFLFTVGKNTLAPLPASRPLEKLSKD